MIQEFNFAKSSVSLSIQERNLIKILNAKPVPVPNDQAAPVRDAIPTTHITLQPQLIARNTTIRQSSKQSQETP